MTTTAKRTARKAPAKKTPARKAPAGRKPAASAPASTTYEEVPLAQIHPDPNNVRGPVGDVDELAASIKAQGVLEPIGLAERTVKVAGKATYLVIYGHRRLAAAHAAGLRTIPALVRTGLDPAQILEAQLTENLHRADISPIHEAKGYERLIATHGRSQRQLVASMGRSQSHISKRLALLKLPIDDQEAVEAGDLAISDAVELAKLADHTDRIRRVRRLRGDNLRNAVRDELTDLANEPKRAAARTQLEKTGYPILDWPSSGSGWWNASFKPHKGTSPVDNLPDYYVSDITISSCAKDHIAATIAPDGTIVTVCTKPRSHDPKPTKPAPKATPAAEPATPLDRLRKTKAERDAEQEQHAREREQMDQLQDLFAAAAHDRAAAVDRLRDGSQLPGLHDTIRDLVAGTDAAARAVLELLAMHLLEQPDTGYAGLKILGVEPVLRPGQWEPSWTAGTYTWADTGDPAERTSRLLLAAIVQATLDLDQGYLDELEPATVTALYRFLTGLGHQPTDAEQAWLAAIAEADR